MYRFRVEYLKDREKHHTLVREHDAMIEALGKHDEEEAVRLVELHIDNQYQSILRELDARNRG